MKKNLFFYAAAAALMLTACTNEDDVVQVNQTVTTVENEGVGFDVYVPQATTRSGRINVMNNNTLKKTGFGIFGYQCDNGTSTTPGTYVTGDQVPNYMWNQQIFFDNTAQAWYYSPLKYWPNETNNDSQKTPAGMPNETTPNYKDRLSFFAYAPWVSSTDGSSTTPIYTDVEEAAEFGITEMTGNDGKCDSHSTAVNDPIVRYVVSTDPNKSVDLLWGVAPAGGLNYTGVDGVPVEVKEGKPLIDLWKPATNTNLKFMFQHALARLGVKVVLAADQVAAGGNFDFGNTKVTVEDIAIWGNFGLDGYLNLNNGTAKEANWIYYQTKADNYSRALHLTAANEGLAEHLRYNWNPSTRATEDYETAHTQQPVTGVTTTVADAIQVSYIDDSKYFKTGDVSTNSDYSYAVTTPSYSATTPYFANIRDNVTWTYAAYNSWTPAAATYYFYKNPQTGAYTLFTPSVEYPTATYWNNTYSMSTGAYKPISSSADETTYREYKAYRRVGDTFTPTGQVPREGDIVFLAEPTEFNASNIGAGTSCYQAIPNYFMVIPTQNANEKITVRIKYHVSTIDSRLKDGIVYTTNEVEKTITLPHMKNGYSYNLKLILGMNSVKVEAEVADWTTMDAEINLPQNTTE